MKERLINRLEELRTEYESGKQQLRNLEAQESNLKNTLLRISGAIQVLEEELAESGEALDESGNSEADEMAVPPDGSPGEND